MVLLRLAPGSEFCLLVGSAVVFDVGLRSKDIRDLLLGARRDRLVLLEFGHRGLISGRHVLVR